MQHLDNAQANFQYIETFEVLNEICNRCIEHDFITIDTEFVRSRTLFPLLGLVQIYDGKHVFLIDTVKIKNLEPLKTLISDKSTIKVLHSCSEDLDALNKNVGAFPQPVFDTQIAANILGMGNSIGYANLVEQICHLKLDKTESRTDWISRPLTNEQLNYAVADVTHLYKIYRHILLAIEEKGSLNVVYEEVNLMIEKKAKSIPADLAYLNYSNNWKLSGKRLYALKLLAEWRLLEARSSNIAINFVVKESVIFQIALKLPINKQQLANIQGLNAKQIRQYSDSIFQIIDHVENAQSDKYPSNIQRLNDFPAYKQLFSSMKAVIADVASQQQIPDSFLGSKKQINELLKWLWFDINELVARDLRPDLINGWRRQILLEDIQRLINTYQRQFNVLRGL